MYKIRKNQGDYVSWDGKTLYEFGGNPILSECILLDDMLYPIELKRQVFLEKEIHPIIIFGCKSGKSSYRKKINGQYQDVFLYNFFKVKELYGETNSAKDLITHTNVEIRRLKVDQCCEVICLREQLDEKILASNKKNKFALFVFDMCRTKIDNELAKLEASNPYLKQLKNLINTN